MKHGGKMLVCLAGSLALCTAATARTADGGGNPYQAIVERNVFGLKPPPPPPDPEANKPPLPKITLQGITTVLGHKRVLLKTPPGPAKPGEPPKAEQGFILSEGERQEEIEVLEIDENAGRVKINYGGTVTELTFDKDGVKTPAGPGAVPMPGVPPPMKTVMAVPGAGGVSGMGAAPFPNRALRLPGAPGFVSPQTASGAGLPAVNVGGTTMGLSGSSAGASPSAAAQAAVPQRSVEENYLLLEANRLRHQDEIQAGRYPPLPRHPMAEAINPTPEPAPAPVTTPARSLPLPPGAARQWPPAAQ